jgi:hypothetical protein
MKRTKAGSKKYRVAIENRGMDRYVQATLWTRDAAGVWRMHATINGMTRTELVALARYSRWGVRER